jgi:hypothetical protein
MCPLPLTPQYLETRPWRPCIDLMLVYCVCFICAHVKSYIAGTELIINYTNVKIMLEMKNLGNSCSRFPKLYCIFVFVMKAYPIHSGGHLIFINMEKCLD